MAKAFSVASWNTHNLSDEPGHFGKIISFLKQQDPDVFALYEVIGKDVFADVTQLFPSYTCQITEGDQTQEILVGVRGTLTCFISQRVDFKSSVSRMRPGLLATITIDGVYYTLLFLHLASSHEPRGMGLRDDMLERAVKLRGTLDKAVGGKNKANYIFLGDLNTMGMDYPFQKEINPETELRKWDSRASQYYGMRRLKKAYDKTWYGGSASSLPPSDIDHVYSAKQLSFKPFKNPQNESVDVDVRGWVNEPSAKAQDDWRKSYSDHSLLYFEVQKVV